MMGFISKMLGAGKELNSIEKSQKEAAAQDQALSNSIALYDDMLLREQTTIENIQKSIDLFERKLLVIRQRSPNGQLSPTDRRTAKTLAVQLKLEKEKMDTKEKLVHDILQRRHQIQQIRDTAQHIATRKLINAQGQTHMASLDIDTVHEDLEQDQDNQEEIKRYTENITKTMNTIGSSATSSSTTHAITEQEFEELWKGIGSNSSTMTSNETTSSPNMDATTSSVHNTDNNSVQIANSALNATTFTTSPFAISSFTSTSHQHNNKPTSSAVRSSRRNPMITLN